MTLLNSNAITHNYRAIYDYEYTKDSINSIRGKDVALIPSLAIAAEKSSLQTFLPFGSDFNEST